MSRVGRKYKKINKINKSGFTLVELIVVLVILGILAAIMVPSLIGWIDKAKNQDAILECRSVVMAAQGQVAEIYGKNPSTDLKNVINNSETKENILKTAGVESDKTSARIGTIVLGDSSNVVELRYLSSKGVTVTYNALPSPVYIIGGSIDAANDAPGYQQQVINIKDDAKAWDKAFFLDKDGNLYDKYKGLITKSELDSNPTKRLQVAYIEKYGEFPTVDWTQFKFPTEYKFTVKDAVWRPIIANDKDGKEVVVMIAADNRTGPGGATMVYDGEKYYFHHNNYGSIDSAYVSDSGFNVETLEGNPQWVEYK